MLAIFSSIASSLQWTEQKKPSNFHLFGNLPPELRLKIWHHALPERMIEASLQHKDGSWTCSHSASLQQQSTSRPRSDPRKLPTLFSVNVESRQLCLSEYVKFSQTYIHPTIDFLYISWYSIPANAVSENTDTKFYNISGQPLSRFEKIAMTIGRNASFDTRFGALIDCLHQLGAPRELLLSLVGPKLPQVRSVSQGFSISNGNTVALLDWPHTVDSKMAEDARDQVMGAIDEEHQLENFEMPTVSNRLYYIYSGP